MNKNHLKIIGIFIISFIIIFTVLKICDFKGVTETLTRGRVDTVENLNKTAADTTLSQTNK